MVQQKVQLKEDDLAFIENVCRIFEYRSKSEYMRAAIEEKIRSDKRRLRELKRQQAMDAYAGDAELVFHELEAEDFEDR